MEIVPIPILNLELELSLGTECSVVGIDLGTTRSVVAHVAKWGSPYAIPNSEGDITTPSAVLFENGTVVVGKEALKAHAVMPSKRRGVCQARSRQAVFFKTT